MRSFTLIEELTQPCYICKTMFLDQGRYETYLGMGEWIKVTPISSGLQSAWSGCKTAQVHAMGG